MWTFPPTYLLLFVPVIAPHLCNPSSLTTVYTDYTEHSGLSPQPLGLSDLDLALVCTHQCLHGGSLKCSHGGLTGSGLQVTLVIRVKDWMISIMGTQDPLGAEKSLGIFWDLEKGFINQILGILSKLCSESEIWVEVRCSCFCNRLHCAGPVECEII